MSVEKTERKGAVRPCTFVLVPWSDANKRLLFMQMVIMLNAKKGKISGGYDQCWF